MPRYWMLWLSGLLYLVFAASTHATMAATLRPDMARPSVVAHPKRGIASSRYLATDPARLRALGANWAYDWSATPPEATHGLEWVPMVWGSGSVTHSSLATLTAARRSGRARYLLGFNEPDSGSQSHLTPAQAAALWPALERTGLSLGSPAPQVPTDGWLTSFMRIARQRHLRVNFIALHYYQDFTNPDAVGQLRAQLVALHKQFGKPIWITEIGAIDLRAWGEPISGAPSDAVADRYIGRLFTMLDGLSFVKRYAWFTDDCWNHAECRYGSLFTGSGQATPAARAFTTAS